MAAGHAGDEPVQPEPSEVVCHLARGVHGRLAAEELGDERVTRRRGDSTAEVDELSVVTDAGELRTVELGAGVSVRVRDRDLADQLSAYLNLLASRRQRDLRCMHITTAGQGDREIFVSHVSEVPVWKTTYRIVVPSKGAEKPLLQGWAIVDLGVVADRSQQRIPIPPGRGRAGAPGWVLRLASAPCAFSSRHRSMRTELLSNRDPRPGEQRSRRWQHLADVAFTELMT